MNETAIIYLCTMLKEYSISDILELPARYIPYYADTFERMEDPDTEWPHRHTFHSVVWFTKGTGMYVIDSHEYEIKPQRIFFVNPKQVHNWDYSENSEGYVLVVDKSLAIELNMEHQIPYIDLDTATAQLLEPVFRNLMAEYNSNTDISIDIQYLNKITERFAENTHAIRTLSNPTFDKFKALVLNDISKNPPIEDCARNLSLSVEDLNTLTKQIVGVSSKQYILDLKITEAKRLLIYSSYNINEIAFHLGFEDPSYFSRIFRKKTGCSPTAFLKKYRKQGQKS